MAVFAPNAKGKSSLIDALEFFFSDIGTLERLGQRRSGRQAGREALEHVKAQETDIPSAVSMVFHSSDDVFDGTRSIAGYDQGMPEAAERVRRARKLDFIIRGYQLRHFVDRQEPSDRYKEVSAWFGLSALLEIQNNLRSVRRKIKEELDTDRTTRERQRDLRTTTEGELTAWDEQAATAWVTKQSLKPLDADLSLAVLDEADPGYQTVKQRKEAEEQSMGLTALRQARSATLAVYNKSALKDDDATKETGALPAFHKAVDAFLEAKAKEENERAASSSSIFKNLWEAAEPILDDPDMPLDECPVCETPFPDTVQGSRDAVALHVQTELANLQAYRDAVSALQNAQQTLHHCVQELKSRLSTLETLLDGTDFDDQIPLVKTYAASVAAFEHGQAAPDSKKVITPLGELESQLQEEIRHKEETQGEHTWTKVCGKLDALIKLKSQFAFIGRYREELQALHDNTVEQESFIAGRMRLHGQMVIDTLKARMNEIFRAVHPDDEAPDVSLELNPDSRRPELALLIDFAPNRQGVPPSGYLSDSQIHTLALSLRLAAIQMFNSEVPIIVLDDVVTSYDADHRRAIAGMLADQFADHQIILVTHDERFFAYLQEQLPQDKWLFKRITRLDPDFGPRFHDHRVPDDVIAAKHAAEESAANEMRQSEEEWLTQICRDFGVEVRIRDVHHPYDYSRAELAAALAQFLKRRDLIPPRVPGVNNRFLSTLQSGSVENFGSHFQNNPYGFGSVGDERTRWAEFRAFRDAFRCVACGRRRFKRPLGMDRPVCRHNRCETRFAFE